MTDVFNFTSGFLPTQKNLWLKAGISEEAADTLIGRLEKLRAAIKAWRSNPEAVRASIIRLRNEACHQAKMLQGEAATREEKERLQAQLKKIVYFLGGATLVGINAGSLAATFGLNALGTAISGAFGGALMGAAVG
jgi:hypothetical protein